MPEVSASPIPIQSVGARPRLESVDLLRGLAIVIMALDHVRDFFSHDLLYFSPTDLTKTTAALFLTRWITHFCAPIFCFLAGTGAFLSFGRGKTKSELANFLVTRGLWLVFLELTFVQFAWTFHLGFPEGAGVIWVLGWSMVALATLIYLPIWAITTFGIVMIAGHNFFDPVAPEAFGSFSWLWKVLHVSASIPIGPHTDFFIVYPLIPWIGVMAVGYSFGVIVKQDRARRRKKLFLIGGGLIAAFILIRAANIYGDPHPWSMQVNPLFTFFSFINCVKYPPSLCYLLMTLGPAIFLLGLLDHDLGRFWRPLIVFGRVPLFFYILHLYLIHALALLISYVRHGSPAGLLSGPAFDNPTSFPPDYGFGVGGIYALWLLVVLLLYPLCRWFADLKQRRRDAWLSYL
jgi:uncharacterized membrane protein